MPHHQVICDIYVIWPILLTFSTDHQ